MTFYIYSVWYVLTDREWHRGTVGTKRSTHDVADQLKRLAKDRAFATRTTVRVRRIKLTEIV